MYHRLPQVCKLWLGLNKGMLPVGHLTSNILTAVNCCGRQLARRLGWVAPAYHKKEDARVDSELSEEFAVNVGMHTASVLSPVHFAVVVDVVIEFA